MTKIYKIKNMNDDVLKELLELEFYVDPLTKSVCYWKQFDYESDLAKSVLAMFNSDQFRKELKSNKSFEKGLLEGGIAFRGKKVIENDAFVDMASQWQIEIEVEEEGWIALTSVNPMYPMNYYKKDLLDKYFGDILNTLLEKGIIEVIEVEG